MKLSTAELKQLRKSCDGRDLLHMLDDVCELITAKIVLRVNMKARKYHKEMEQFPIGSQDRAALAALTHAMKQLMVELAEAE